MTITTSGDLIRSALLRIQAYAPGETPTDADMELALDEANLLLDAWSTESLSVYAFQEQSTVLTINKLQYTIGTSGGADLNMARPIRMLTGPGVAYVQDPQNNRYDVDVLTQDEFNRIWNIVNTSSSWPTAMFYDPQFPLGIIKIYPAPNVGGMTLFWDSYLPLTAFADIFTALSFPPGYQLALRGALARQLWRPFKPLNAPIPTDLVAEAAAAKKLIKRVNNREQQLGFDPALYVRGQGYNVYSDATARR